MANPPAVPFETTAHVRDACLCLHTQRAARALARRFDEALRPAGLTNEQFSLLMALNRPQVASMGEVAALLGVDRTTLTAAVKPMLRRGLAEVGVDARDSRVRRIWLTPEGHACLTAALPLWTGAHATLEVELGAADPGRLRRDLKILSASAGQVPAPDLCELEEQAP